MKCIFFGHAFAAKLQGVYCCLCETAPVACIRSGCKMVQCKCEIKKMHLTSKERNKLFGVKK